MRNALVLVSLSVWLAACGDNLGAGDGVIDAAAIDASGPVDAPLDAQSCPQAAAGTPGGPCATDAECDSAPNAMDGFCLNNLLDIAPWPSQGYCLGRIGGCTDDAECGTGNVCVTLDEGTADEISACMRGCSAEPCACPDAMICSDTYVGTPIDKMICIPGNPNSIDGAVCETFGDCDNNSICLADAFEAPSGQCMEIGCTTGNDATCTSGGDGHCGPAPVFGGGTGCLDRCNTNADCRSIDGFVCFDAGGTTGKFCRHPATGDACAVDTDCGPAAIWDCKTGATFPDGYCTIQQECTLADPMTCSPGSSVCNDPIGLDPAFCVDRCTTPNVQSTCRTGYTCRDVDPTASEALGCVFP